MMTTAHNHPTPDRARLFWAKLAIFPFILAIRLYQVTLSPIMSGHCRFIPTCSNYAIDAYRIHGPWRGSLLTLRRLSRCRPWGGTGYDPVPERDTCCRSPRPTPTTCEHHQADQRA